MAYAFVQEVHTLTFANGSPFSLPSITPTTGHLLVSWVCSTGSAPAVMSDTGSNVWTQVGTPQKRGGLSGAYYIAMFWAIATGSASVLTYNSGGSFGSAQTMEFSGNASASVLDASGQAGGTGTAPTCAVAANYDNELIVAASCPFLGGTWGPAAGWNQPSGSNPTAGLTYGGIFAVESTTGTYNPTFTTTSDDWGIIAGSFKPAG